MTVVIKIYFIEKEDSKRSKLKDLNQQNKDSLQKRKLIRFRYPVNCKKQNNEDKNAQAERGSSQRVGIVVDNANHNDRRLFFS